MKRKLRLLLLFCSFLLTSCGDQTNLEEQQITLLLGIDLDKDDKIKAYSASPVFSQEAIQKYNISVGETKALRQARKELDSMSIGSLVGGKVQNILIGKKLLQQKNAFQYFDSFFRDPKNEVNGIVIVVDGDVTEIVKLNMKDKGRIGVVLREQVETTYENRSTVRTTLQQFHRQMSEPGMTPYVTQIRPGNNEIIVTGSALLSENGKYATSIDGEKSSLFLMMNGDARRPIPLIMKLSPKTLGIKKKEVVIACTVNSVKTSISTKYQKRTFGFDIEMNLGLIITERPFQFDTEKQGKQFEKAMEDELKKQCEALIKVFQKHQIDPLGLGLHARAYQYKEWKKVEKEWGKTFSKATITIKPKVKVISYGVSK